MKANSLMIGDIVNLCYRDLPLKVLGLDVRNKSILVEVQDNFKLKIAYDEEEIKPIPLTEEILKANGWKKNDPHWVSTLRRYCDKDGSKWSLSFTLQKGIWDAYIHNGGDLNINKFHPMYVHELQHALRLCGLNELADNLKIE